MTKDIRNIKNPRSDIVRAIKGPSEGFLNQLGDTWPDAAFENRPEALTHPIDDLRQRFIAAEPSTKMADIFPEMPAWGFGSTGMKIIPADMKCPNCGKELERGHVYRAGYDASSYRTIPPHIGRGEYCEHVPDPGRPLT